MVCKPRIYYPGAFYHVMLCGNGGQDILFFDADHSRFHLLLQEGVERYNHRILAFCQMTDHIHLAIQVGNIPLSRIMQNVSFRYTRYINARKNKIGHLFQGRYKALLIDGDELSRGTGQIYPLQSGKVRFGQQSQRVSLEQS